jgi:hypothetical protein
MWDISFRYCSFEIKKDIFLNRVESRVSAEVSGMKN